MRRTGTAPLLLLLGGLFAVGPLPVSTGGLPALPLAGNSLPGWAIPLVVAGVIALAAVFFLLSRRRQE